jgi:hypothetical protein
MLDERETKAVAHEGGESAETREDAADKIIIQRTRNALQRDAHNRSKINDTLERENIEIYDEAGFIRKRNSKITFVWLLKIFVLLIFIVLGIYFMKSSSFEKIQSFVELKSRDFLVFIKMKIDKNPKKSQIISNVISVYNSNDANKQDNTSSVEISKNDEDFGVPSSYNSNDTNKQDNTSREEISKNDEDSGSVKYFTIKKEIDTGKDIIVKEGDTFMKILMREYGEYNENIVSLVLEANQEIKEINTILIGQRIHLPAR